MGESIFTSQTSFSTMAAAPYPALGAGLPPAAHISLYLYSLFYIEYRTEASHHPTLRIRQKFFLFSGYLVHEKGIRAAPEERRPWKESLREEMPPMMKGSGPSRRFLSRG
jgi:hypothetical protein